MVSVSTLAGLAGVTRQALGVGLKEAYARTPEAQWGRVRAREVGARLRRRMEPRWKGASGTHGRNGAWRVRKGTILKELRRAGAQEAARGAAFLEKLAGKAGRMGRPVVVPSGEDLALALGLRPKRGATASKIWARFCRSCVKSFAKATERISTGKKRSWWRWRVSWDAVLPRQWRASEARKRHLRRWKKVRRCRFWPRFPSRAARKAAKDADEKAFHASYDVQWAGEG